MLINLTLRSGIRTGGLNSVGSELRSEPMGINRCKECHFKYELIRYAKGRAIKKKCPSNLIDEIGVAMK